MAVATAVNGEKFKSRTCLSYIHMLQKYQNFMVLDQFLFEVACKNTETHTHTHCQVLYSCDLQKCNYNK